ncbi:MAG: hypothetical protein ACTS2F_12040 [Thainema sp.]
MGLQRKVRSQVQRLEIEKCDRRIDLWDCRKNAIAVLEVEDREVRSQD